MRAWYVQSIARRLVSDALVEDAPPVSSREHLRQFQFIREIASGGFGSVYLTKVMHSDGFSRLVAVKVLKAQWSDSDEVACRMRDEARLLGLLRHRNIVDVIDLTAIDGRAAVIMEYLEAVDLRTVVQEVEAKRTRVPLRAALEVASAVASALDAAYNRPPIPGDKPLRVIHRDIKPSNIMVDETGMVKVLDFGVARSEIDNRESHTQELQFGSVDYMAPERLFFEPETPASDVYSLAATLFEILALEKFGKSRGRPARHSAFVVDRLSFLRAQLGIGGAPARELEQLIGGGLSFNHEDRPTASEFHQRARALSRVVGSEDLSSWAEHSIATMVHASTAAQPTGGPLTGQTLHEDPRAFDESPPATDSQSAGPANVLRQGALAEMEDTGAFVPSPQTGAPAQLHGRKIAEADVEAEWDDVPTAAGALNGPVRVSRPGNAEEARMMNAGRPRQTVGPKADPSDPFAQLVRSPLSPPKTPQPRSVPRPEDVEEDDGVTEVADTLQPVVPSQPVAARGDYDPSAPEADAPIAPLPAPPGVEPRPLEPVLPEAASAPEEEPEVSSAKEDEEAPETPPADTDFDTEESGNDSPFEKLDTETALPTLADADADGDDSASVPVVAPPGAIYEQGEATSIFTSVTDAQKPAAPVQLGKVAEEDTAELPGPAEQDGTDLTVDETSPPSLDDVVPRSLESRYGPEVERLVAAEGGQAAVSVVPVYEPTVDSISVPPASSQEQAQVESASVAGGMEQEDEDSLHPTVPFGATEHQIDDELLAPTEHIAGRWKTVEEPNPATAPNEAAAEPVAVAASTHRSSSSDSNTETMTDFSRASGRKTTLWAAVGCLMVVAFGGAGALAAWQLGALDGLVAASTSTANEG
ncbi:MAG: hypothetical protein CL927_17670, partial [Deltaproteobacteria bacterium]|nr:hypothetical protein [Deltaproteobacteria bacterium]HCH66812.1 hypothetical protein [Deltaproteobacteria bacterium]